MMSSLLFYHKKENPSLSPLRMRGVVGSSGSARSGPEGLLPRVNLANPEVCAPRLEENVARPRGGGRIGTSFLPLLGEFIPGLSREDEGAGAPHCAPGRATRTARAMFPKYSRLCVRASHSATHTPSECDGDRTHKPLGLETRPPSRAHTLRFFSGLPAGEIRPGADGRPLPA